MELKTLESLLGGTEQSDELWIEIDGWEYPVHALEVNEALGRVTLKAFSGDEDDEYEDDNGAGDDDEDGPSCAMPERVPTKQEPTLKEA